MQAFHLHDDLVLKLHKIGFIQKDLYTVFIDM